MVSRNRVVDYIVGHLAHSGIDHIFGVDGANIEDLYDAAYFRSDITAVLAKHEFSAAAMADGFSRSGAGLGVVAATSGGGALNTVPGLGEAFASRVPVLALIGQPPTNLDGLGAFQDTSGRNGALDGVALFSAVSVYCRRVTEPQDIISALPQAISAARGGGPAVLLLPKDVQQAVLGSLNGHGHNGVLRSVPLEAPHVIARALRQADGPITILAGEQVVRDDARAELERLRALLRARVATVPDAKDAAGTPGLGSSSALGVTGVMGHPGVVDAVAESALCLVVGTRLSVTARAGLDAALAAVPTFSIGSAPPYVPCTHVHTRDLRGSLELLVRALSGSGRPAHVRVPDTVARTALRPPAHTGPGVRYRDAMAVVDAALPDGVDIVVDAGNIGASAIHHLPARRDGRFIVALGMGGMGYSFGAGLGVAFGRAMSACAKSNGAPMSACAKSNGAPMSACAKSNGAPMSACAKSNGAPMSALPSPRTVVIAGDGSFFMHGMEIHTAVQYRLPVTYLLFDNHAHAMCVTREQLFYHDLYSYNRFGPSRLGAGLAAMFPGLTAVDVDEIGELPAALATALATDGPSVVSVQCSADEIPPFAAFLSRPRDHSAIQKETHDNVVARA